MELHDSHYNNIVHVADECPIMPAQFVQYIDGNWTGLLRGYLWVLLVHGMLFQHNQSYI